MAATAQSPPSPVRLRIAVVGDVHDEWDSVMDLQALRALKPDVVLFTGDFGNANVDLVRDVSKLELPKAVILGNHDCWQIFPPIARHMSDYASDRNAVAEQLNLLGDSHVGFGRLDFPDLRLSVVGGRPFSMGGDRINGLNEHLVPRYGVHNLRESAERIAANAKEAPQENFLVFLGHNGPSGLGSEGEDICGRDFSERGGDHGDPDFEEAIASVKDEGMEVSLVVFGHMHEKLQCRHDSIKRTMLVVRDNTIYLNAAIVPRVRAITDPELATSSQRHFALVNLNDTEIESIYEVWVTVQDEDCKVNNTVMYSRPGTASLE